MFGSPLNLRLTGAQTLRDGQMQARSVVIEDGVISKGPLPEVDLTGYYVLPGIIDLQSEALYRHGAPHLHGAALTGALAAIDREAASNGVTTALLAQGWSWEGGARSPEQAKARLVALDRYRPHQLVDLHMQLRVETHIADSVDDLISAVKRHAVTFVMFSNRLPDARDFANRTSSDIVRWAEGAGCHPQDYSQLVQRAFEDGPQVPRNLCRLASLFDEQGVLYGSHHDPDAATREYYSMIGAKICQFPTGTAAAAAAIAVGDVVVTRATDLVCAASKARSYNASAMIQRGLCHALASDSYYPALHLAAFKLVEERVMDLARAWNMISRTPAEILRLPDRGVIDYGKRADLTIIDAATRSVECTIVNGRMAFLSGGAAERMLAGLKRTRRTVAA
ncbi:alpha-D-ribose 1-methylphosphonate 5-triphosphate diphosphatase [Lutimaribacter sp. EGI FJ00015]|uniref:Alpha-D-ribose 1-methylphosphonate 5-triphosphate diphosphatase n=1 Tax=Lutimaribacter degradans TaxID=2945989 RepID=A0ACC5ZYE7_9RHOB|nr:alpha-D-ribose 1-methylphosphonate 5-triphosphate diphosphatase [Lutimaribacter sp. EGI FJ00013]MCM2563366.1 alpha-D-ribose 1-methylphosphonate 5-triphosphate diphosphatase [Lutimaribacter sp. EGI FJ00013]MCO0614555.1 alpha-D-ribose 1-methylphosphonate 5-triphosphate diphosphatase [Lutimaribacter sp. EGI FJ00015]MCO0637228.1 alpha-D-ribose 1-methylphosphonate 5-triphosphate diphosphatase [Lutimaribacter sp. EGI FJ00014]